MIIETHRTPVEHLSLAATDGATVNYDWSSGGWPDRWDWFKIVKCGWCDEEPAQDDISVNVTLGGWSDERAEEAGASKLVTTWWIDVSEGYCANPECSNFNESPIEEEDLDGGPMMNYFYPLPDTRSFDQDDARKIDHLPLVLVQFHESYSEDAQNEAVTLPDFALALSGGGMDLTWEIAEAFMCLGYLPPVEHCALPGICGRGALTSGGKTEGEVSERDAWIIAGCNRALQGQADRYLHTIARNNQVATKGY